MKQTEYIVTLDHLGDSPSEEQVASAIEQASLGWFAGGVDVDNVSVVISDELDDEQG